jgi:23S rRNA pseudouridine1911/1915/1917 synthase
VSEPIRHAFVVEVGGERLDKGVAARLPHLSRARVQALIREGAVTVDGAAAKPSLKLEAGAEVVVLEPPPAPAAPQPEDIPLEILYQDQDLAVVLKPAGLVVHPAPGHPGGTMVNALLHALDDLSGVGGELRPGIVHRLDKGTSGVMVVAKHDEAHRALGEQFSAHTIERRYHALVLGGPRFLSGTIENELGRDPRDRLRFTEVERGGRRAVTHWQVLERLHRACLLECRLETGRTHQIRVHLSEAGWPVLGDPMYRARLTPPRAVAEAIDGVDHQLLHARVLAFDHPTTGERLRFERDVPQDFQRALEALRGAEA